MASKDKKSAKTVPEIHLQRGTVNEMETAEL